MALVTSLSSYLMEILLFGAKPAALALTSIPTDPLSGSIARLGIIVKVFSVTGGSVVTLCSPVVLGGTVKVASKVPLSSTVAVVTSSSSYLRETLFPGSKPVASAFTSIPTGPLFGISILGTTINSTPLIAFVAQSSKITRYSPLSETGTVKVSLTLPLVAFPAFKGFVSTLSQ